MTDFDHGLCFDSQQIQLTSLYITTENFTGLDYLANFDQEFASLSVFPWIPNEFNWTAI